MLGWELALLVKPLEGPLMAVKYSWLLFAPPNGETEARRAQRPTLVRAREQARAGWRRHHRQAQH